jgi:hypothetical protein
MRCNENLILHFRKFVFVRGWVCGVGGLEQGHAMPLRLIIENSAPEDVEPQSANPSADFIEAAIRAAKHSRHSARDLIVTEVSELLGCAKEDLEFLFGSRTSVNTFRFPDYCRDMDRLEAAE